MKRVARQHGRFAPLVSLLVYSVTHLDESYISQHALPPTLIQEVCMVLQELIDRPRALHLLFQLRPIRLNDLRRVECEYILHKEDHPMAQLEHTHLPPLELWVVRYACLPVLALLFLPYVGQLALGHFQLDENGVDELPADHVLPRYHQRDGELDGDVKLQ